MALQCVLWWAAIGGWEWLRSLTAVIPCAAQVCLALQYIHREKHVVHRDLTPSNIMIGADDVVKVADFGLAKQVLMRGQGVWCGEWESFIRRVGA